jgi:hypothetical protein
MRQVELVDRENTDLEGYERLYIESLFFPTITCLPLALGKVWAGWKKNQD